MSDSANHPAMKGKFRGTVAGPQEEEVAVDQEIYLKWVKKQLDNESACLQLPFTVILLFSFIGMALLHLRQYLVYTVEQAIERDIVENANFAFEVNFGNKGLQDAFSYADFWSWVRLGFLPLVIQPTWSTSERYAEDSLAYFGNVGAAPNEQWDFQAFGGDSKPIPVTGDYLHYNRIIGGLHLEQLVSPFTATGCKFPGDAGGQAAWQKWYGKPCSPGDQDLYFIPDTLDGESFQNPQRGEWFLLGGLMTLDDMVQKAVDMEDGCSQLEAKGRTGKCLCEWCTTQNPAAPWLQEDTTRIRLSMATYNAEYGLLTLTGVQFFFDRGSEAQKRVEMMSLWVDPFAMPLSHLIPTIMCDLIWGVMVMFMLVTEVQDIVHALKTGEGPHWYNSIINDYISFWNMVDWASIAVSIAIVSLFGTMLANNSSLCEALHALLEVEVNSETVTREVYQPLVEDFFTKLEASLAVEKMLRLQFVAYPMMVMMRLFKSFAAQARLAVVTDTIIAAYQDLVHFFIVFFGVFFCLCICSVLFFGQDSPDFATIFRAVHTCFRMMFGDWDWDKMDSIRRSVAMIWFSIVMTLMVMILLNMLLAIIMDNYMKVKTKISDPSLAPSLMKQIQEMYRRRVQYKQGKRVRLNDIYSTFLAMHDGNEKSMLRCKKMITPTFLIETVPNIEEKQATRTLTNAKDEHRKANEKEFDIADLNSTDNPQRTSVLQRLDDGTRKIRDTLLYIQDRVTFYDTVVTDMSAHSKDASALMASAAALSAQHAAESSVSDEVLEHVGAEVARLNYETATVLGQTLRRVDLRQHHIEQRQEDMVGSIREMHQSLLNLQSEAQSLSNKLRRLKHDQDKALVPVWTGFAKGAVPPCFTNCSTMDTQESAMPGLRTSPNKVPT